MSETSVETSVMPGKNGGTLRAGGGNPQGNGGRPSEEFRRRCGEKLDEWLNRADELLVDLVDSLPPADDAMSRVENRTKVVETILKTSREFGRYTGLEKKEVEQSGESVMRVVFEDEPKRGE